MQILLSYYLVRSIQLVQFPTFDNVLEVEMGEFDSRRKKLLKALYNKTLAPQEESQLLNEWNTLLMERDRALREKVNQHNRMLKENSLVQLYEILQNVGMHDHTDTPEDLKQSLCHIYAVLKKYYQDSHIDSDKIVNQKHDELHFSMGEEVPQDLSEKNQYFGMDDFCDSSNQRNDLITSQHMGHLTEMGFPDSKLNFSQSPQLIRKLCYDSISNPLKQSIECESSVFLHQDSNNTEKIIADQSVCSEYIKESLLSSQYIGEGIQDLNDFSIKSSIMRMESKYAAGSDIGERAQHRQETFISPNKENHSQVGIEMSRKSLFLKGLNKRFLYPENTLDLVSHTENRIYRDDDVLKTNSETIGIESDFESSLCLSID